MGSTEQLYPPLLEAMSFTWLLQCLHALYDGLIAAGKRVQLRERSPDSGVEKEIDED